MNTTVPSLSLQTAVLNQVQEFATNNATFSIYEITKEIRNKVNQGTWEIPETEIVGSSFRNDIPHSRVRNLFYDLWNSGVFDNQFNLNRVFNGNYNEFTPANVVSTIDPAANAVSQTVAPPANNVSSATSPIDARVQLYLNNCKTKGSQPTLKQVQSAIKRRNSGTGISCSDLYNIVVKLGYNLIADPDFISLCRVIIY